MHIHTALELHLTDTTAKVNLEYIIFLYNEFQEDSVTFLQLIQQLSPSVLAQAVHT